MYHWLDKPSEMRHGADFSLFKSGITPDWADISNQGGGRYIVRCGKRETDLVWTELLMSLVGQMLVSEEQEYLVTIYSFNS